MKEDFVCLVTNLNYTSIMRKSEINMIVSWSIFVALLAESYKKFLAVVDSDIQNLLWNYCPQVAL